MNRIRKNRQFHGKVMLFGEYSVILGSAALLVPFKEAWGELCFPAETLKDDLVTSSNKSLKSFAGYLAKLVKEGEMNNGFDLKRFKSDISEGLYFNSDIPENYGLGSSGALCAAVYEEYGVSFEKLSGNNDAAVLKKLKETFSRMESYFHGSSSGTDPLCIYTDSPIHIDLNGEPVIVDPEASLFGKLKPFLINTFSAGYTSVLVLKFLEKIMEPNLRNTFMNDYVPYVNRAVEQFISGNPEMESILEISRKQLKYFISKIPGRYHGAWNQGIHTGLYALKLCGSGGGGMVLGFSQDIEKARDYLLKNHHIPIAAL